MATSVVRLDASLTAMGSHAARRHDDVTPARWLCVADAAGDVVEAWSAVDLALEYVDEMVGRLADVTDDVRPRGPAAVDGDEVSSGQLTDDVVPDDFTSPVDDDINDACHLL